MQGKFPTRTELIERIEKGINISIEAGIYFDRQHAWENICRYAQTLIKPGYLDHNVSTYSDMPFRVLDDVLAELRKHYISEPATPEQKHSIKSCLDELVQYGVYDNREQANKDFFDTWDCTPDQMLYVTAKVALIGLRDMINQL